MQECLDLSLYMVLKPASAITAQLETVPTAIPNADEALHLTRDHESLSRTVAEIAGQTNRLILDAVIMVAEGAVQGAALIDTIRDGARRVLQELEEVGTNLKSGG